VPSLVVLLWQVDVQQPVHGLYLCLNWINFIWQNMDGYYPWAIIRFADKSRMAPKDYQAACGQAQNRGHLRISRAFKQKMKCGRISIKVIAQEFFLRGHPVLKVESVLAAARLKNLIRAFSDRRLDDLPVSILIVLDSDYAICKALSSSPFHTSTPSDSLLGD
jgi:hypothetical protein